MRYLGLRMKKLLMMDWEAMELPKIPSRFLAWATGWKSLGTMEEFGVGGAHNFNLRKKKHWSDESSVSSLESEMGKTQHCNTKLILLCDWYLIMSFENTWHRIGFCQLSIDSTTWHRALLQDQGHWKRRSTLFICRDMVSRYPQ